MGYNPTSDLEALRPPSENGIAAFTADVLADNHSMMRVFHIVADKMEITLEGGIYQLRFDLAPLNASKQTRNK